MTLLNLLRPRLAAAAVFALLERYKKTLSAWLSVCGLFYYLFSLVKTTFPSQ